MDSDPYSTQRDVGSAIVSQLRAAGFDDADEIGRGGFGVVYRCTQVRLDRTVAIKVLTTDVAEDRERFLREQRAMGRLTGHPNIAAVLQVGETDGGFPYLVMQYHGQGSLEDRIRRLGLLPVDEVLQIGVKMAGALESAHRLGIMHRDVKPANILLTDYGEPVLSDFGIAHVVDGFKTAAGTFTGSPAFTAPEILGGDPPSVASDIYGLGATLFCALTGHAAYERKSGEKVLTQFLRIATEPVPDLRDSDVPADIADAIATMMSREPESRPTAVAAGEELQRLQSRRGSPVDDMALPTVDRHDEPVGRGDRHPVRHAGGGLPLELTSFVGRGTELAELKSLLSTSRLVTLTGIGGVGKTRLAIRAASEVVPDYPDGVRLVELGELRDGSLLIDVVAAALGMRDESGRPLRDVLVDFLRSRRLLLVLDNCEQVVDDVARLVEEVLSACPDLRLLTTSRERLGVAGESVLRIAPLAYPGADDTLGGTPGYDAIALFAERATAAVPGFRLTDENKRTVADIVSRLEGLPLAIELAAARLRAMSLDQLLERLADRYQLLTRGARGVPTRQQTLSWSVGWSYDLCTPAEQELWRRLSVFAGSFELEAAQDICGADMTEYELLDVVASLVDKSILVRTESDRVVRFRLLDTLRKYGRQRIEQTAEFSEIRRRHTDWYRRLAQQAAEQWFSSRQLDWLARVERETPNIREALEFSLSQDGQAALAISIALQPIWMCQGMLREAWRWTNRALARTPRDATLERVRALYSVALLSPLLCDLATGAASAAEARALVEQLDAGRTTAGVALADGITALVNGDFERASVLLEEGLSGGSDDSERENAMLLLGWTLEFAGDTARGLIWHEKALALAKSHDEVVYRAYALWSLGVGWWQYGRPERAELLLQDGLRATRKANDRRGAAGCLEALAWIAASRDPTRAVVMMGAADTLARAVGAQPIPLPRLVVFHEECVRSTRDALGVEAFDVARQRGSAMTFDDAVAYALSETA